MTILTIKFWVDRNDLWPLLPQRLASLPLKSGMRRLTYASTRKRTLKMTNQTVVSKLKKLLEKKKTKILGPVKDGTVQKMLH